jgi:hypothetical protein
MSGSGATQQKRAVQIHIDDFAPFGGVKVDNIETIWSACCACVIHDDVDTAELLEGARNECIDGGVIGNVANNWNTTLPECTNLIGNRLNIAPTGDLFVGGVIGRRATGSGDDDIAPRTREFHGNGTANRTHASGTGDDCDLAG